jgi:hypothetical protein
MYPTITTDSVSTRIEQHFKALEKAGRVLELAKRANRKHIRKAEEVESYAHFPRLKERAQRQGEIARLAHDRLFAYYKRIIRKISHE